MKKKIIKIYFFCFRKDILSQKKIKKCKFKQQTLSVLILNFDPILKYTVSDGQN